MSHELLQRQHYLTLSFYVSLLICRVAYTSFLMAMYLVSKRSPSWQRHCLREGRPLASLPARNLFFLVCLGSNFGVQNKTFQNPPEREPTAPLPW